MRPTGFTLLETLVALAISGLMLGLAAVAMLAPHDAADEELARRIEEARTRAASERIPVPVMIADGDTLTFWPDGFASWSIVSESVRAWQLNRWTGEVTREP